MWNTHTWQCHVKHRHLTVSCETQTPDSVMWNTHTWQCHVKHPHLTASCETPTWLVSCESPFTSTGPHVRCDVGLEGWEYWKKLSLCYSIVFCYNGAQRYEQFLQVGRLYRALILLGLALLSSKCLCVFGPHGAIYVVKNMFAYILFFALQGAKPGVIGPWRGWLTIVLQCYDTDGWVMWPVKSSLKWPIMCRVGH